VCGHLMAVRLGGWPSVMVGGSRSSGGEGEICEMGQNFLKGLNGIL
jgi:hypothetical protein